MISRSLLLVLLVLACLQSFTTANNGNGPDQCCTKIVTRPIPIRVITDYEVTERQCTKPGVIFTIQNGRLVCADTGIKWVKNHMNRIDQRLFNSLSNTEAVDGPDQCCTKFVTQRIPVRVITTYKVTDPECLNQGVIFTLQNGRHVCADTSFKWVKNHMNRIDQRLFNSLNKPEAGAGPDQCCFRFLTGPIPVRVITDYEVTNPKCTKPGVIFTLQDGRLVCADTGIKWVKDRMNRIDQRLFNSLNNTEDGTVECCFRYQTQPIPARFITDYKVTDPECLKPGVIFTLQNGRRFCANPQDKWVNFNKNTIDQRKTA
ncbi:uncharacterized protein LOC132849131 [Tachysurus vachellii]|uniref:uncharacterized protein LOC132849131 n=1 Tax=Tachysurus vachellii TaxID=175792 RepID=UPI00296B510A|nr:uncharacterized protein LOC132849131 [Tachysurus vachellii]